MKAPNLSMAPHTQVVVSPSGNGIMKSDRRASKPLMEKRRRERINKSLNELKSILLDALRKDSTCHSKLEKADILEMTVRYLRSIQRQRITAAMALDPTVLGKYRNGYVACKAEVAKFLENSQENLHPEVQSRLMTHLGNNNSLPGHLLEGNPHNLMNASAAMDMRSPMRPMMMPLPTKSQMQAMAASTSAQGFLVGGSPRGISPVNSTGNHMENLQASFSGLSSPYSPIRHYSHPSDPTLEHNISPPISPLSPQSQHHHQSMAPVFPAGIQGSFFAIPSSPQHQPFPTACERISSPFDKSLPPSPRSEHSMSPISSKPRSSSPYEQHSSPFHVKSEPQTHSSDESESVWRPW